MSIARLLKDNRGVGAIEYALVASIISVAAISAFHNLGNNVEAKFSKIDQALTKTK